MYKCEPTEVTQSVKPLKHWLKISRRSTLTPSYRCNQEYDKEHQNRSARLKEVQIKHTFLEAVNQVVSQEGVIDDILEVASLFEDNASLESELAILLDKLKLIENETKSLVDQSAKSSEIEVYRKRYDALILEYDQVNAEAQSIQDEIGKRKAKHERILRYAKHLTEIEGPIEAFDDELWFTLLDRAIVKESSIVYRFRDQREIEIAL